MKEIGALLSGYTLPEPKRNTERGDVLQELSQKSGYPIPVIAKFFKGATLQDLRFFASDCRQARVPYRQALLHLKNEWNGKN